MRTPEQILDSIVRDFATPVTRQDAFEGMQEHAIEFLEWANREQTYNHLKGRDDYGWYYEKPSKYPWGVREEFIGDTRDLYQLYLKSIEPKTT